MSKLSEKDFYPLETKQWITLAECSECGGLDGDHDIDCSLDE